MFSCFLHSRYLPPGYESSIVYHSSFCWSMGLFCWPKFFHTICSIVSLYRFALHAVLTNSLCLKTNKGSFRYIDDVSTLWILLFYCSFHNLLPNVLSIMKIFFKHVRHPILTKLLTLVLCSLRPNKRNVLFPVTLPTLTLCRDPKPFIRLEKEKVKKNQQKMCVPSIKCLVLTSLTCFKQNWNKNQNTSIKIYRYIRFENAGFWWHAA